MSRYFECPSIINRITDVILPDAKVKLNDECWCLFYVRNSISIKIGAVLCSGEFMTILVQYNDDEPINIYELLNDPKIKYTDDNLKDKIVDHIVNHVLT